ncbi:MAG: hypothetical protein ACREF9_05705 [Opitutaceae bacterium]
MQFDSMQEARLRAKSPASGLPTPITFEFGILRRELRSIAWMRLGWDKVMRPEQSKKAASQIGGRICRLAVAQKGYAEQKHSNAEAAEPIHPSTGFSSARSAFSAFQSSDLCRGTTRYQIAANRQMRPQIHPA